MNGDDWWLVFYRQHRAVALVLSRFQDFQGFFPGAIFPAVAWNSENRPVETGGRRGIGPSNLIESGARFATPWPVFFGRS